MHGIVLSAHTNIAYTLEYVHICTGTDTSGAHAFVNHSHQGLVPILDKVVLVCHEHLEVSDHSLTPMVLILGYGLRQ